MSSQSFSGMVVFFSFQYSLSVFKAVVLKKAMGIIFFLRVSFCDEHSAQTSPGRLTEHVVESGCKHALPLLGVGMQMSEQSVLLLHPLGPSITNLTL